MAEWKKIVVSGSDISQLNNDSGYLTSGGTIDSASVAARATTLSADATASFADLASDARTADSASVAARATLLSADATASFALVAGNARNADSASVAARATTLSPEATASIADFATTASHALNVPDTASHALTAVSASIADELSQLATASFALVAGNARNADSASVAARATELSADATASFADLASTVHDGNITTAKIADGDVTNVKLANDSVTLGSTEIELGATATSISGLTSISATTGSFVLQVFESSSTIITSGSNIFGDKQDDIQQITGSLTQTGSFTLSGSLLQSHGVISGSFQGDGSGLTGLATNLTVDGDTGTQDVDLLQDDLQIIGTANEIETAVTKVGNDVKVTLNLPDTIAVTSSVATRANELSPLATASFADVAGTARNSDSASVAARATTLSADATASFADLASVARNANSASVAARATTLSADATASFADLASTVHDGNITTNKIADANVTNAKLENDSVTLGSTEITLGTTTTSISGLDSISATTGSFVLQVFESSSTIITSGSNIFGDKQDDTQQITGSLLQTGSAIISGSLDVHGAISGSFVGDGSGLTGIIADSADSASVAARATTLSPDATASFADLASSARSADSASVAARATTLSADATASFADLASSARNADSSSVAARATTLSPEATASIADFATQLSTDATASFADAAGTARNADSASVAARATTLSADATASFADVAGTVHDGNITTAKIADNNVTNAKLQNDSITFGTTEQALGSTITSISGLDAISAVTGTFVLQVFESSSTIITSGSNVFGDKQDDIQQFTGSILQTGSMIVSGNLDVAVGQISGTFVGDGSGLTGVASNLTVDGDTGTQEVSLIDDDLQILGTTDRITSAVTKVGNDVRVTLDLPDTVEVTASVATRANTLSPLATASFADLASSARNADSASVAARATTLSVDATASFADLASSARTADSASNATNSISASAIVAGHLFPTTQGLEGQGIALDANLDFIYGDFFGTGSTKKLNQSVAAATWSFQHDLNEAYPIVQTYDSNGDQIIAERVESIDANNVKLYFAEDTAGVAAAMVGGMGVSASNATQADSASVATRATTLSPEATASIADTATTASHALSGAGTFSGSFVGDGSGLTGVAGDFNFDGDTGATTINLLTETASFNGTAEEIVTTVTANTLTIGLPSDVTIANDLTVTNDATIAGNLTVGGSIVSASSLAIEDQFIILASGSNGAIDGGIIVNQIDDHPDGKGTAFAYDSSANRWALETGLNDTASVITPDAYMGVIQEGTFDAGTAPLYGGAAGKGTIFVDDSGDIYIYG